MSRKPTSKRTRPKPKAVLRLPDLDQAKSAVLNSLTSTDAQRGYRHAIDEFVDWYCSEPTLSFNRTVVLRYRIHLKGRRLAPGTVNLRLGAVRRLAYEAADYGLLSPDLNLLAVLLACGLRRHETVELSFSHIQQREDHWAIVELKGKAGHILTILVPTWVRMSSTCGFRPRTLHRAQEFFQQLPLVTSIASRKGATGEITLASPVVFGKH